MKLLFKLIFREAWYHRARISLAVIATMAMSCMVVWLIGSIDLMILRFDNEGENYLGSFHVAMMPSRSPNDTQQPPTTPMPMMPVRLQFPESVLDELRSSDQVAHVAIARQIRNVMAKMEDENDDTAALRRQRAGTGTPMQSPPLVGIDTHVSPFELQDGRWFADDSAPGAAAAMEGVIGSAAAGSLQIWGEEGEPVKVGDTVICRVDSQDHKIKVVGTFDQKSANVGRGGFGGGISPLISGLFVSTKTAEKISPSTEGEPKIIDYVYLRLRPDVKSTQFKKSYQENLKSRGITMRFMDFEDVQEELKRNRERAGNAGGGGGLMGGASSRNSVIIFSTLVSILIVFTALSMGISERTRVFAMLRSVGMPRRGIAVLVFGESLILSVLGWAGGMFAGWLILQLTVWLQPEAFGGNKTVPLGITAITTAGIAALIGSLLAAIYPAWRGAKIDPLDGMNRSYSATIQTRWFVITAIAGVLLLMICPICTHVDSLAKGTELRVFLYTFIGLPTQIIGCVLIAPAAIVLVEKIFTPLVARILCIRKELLANQLSINIWRTLGTTIAISIGLGVYSFLEISGYSMLVPFTHSKTLPNTLVTMSPTGLPLSEIDTIRKLTGVDSERFLPVALEQSRFSQKQSTLFINNGLNPQQTNGIVFGIDIKEAFAERPNGRPLIEVDFQEGTLKDALEKLQTGGRYCLIPDSFAFRAKLHVGDKIELVVPNDFNPANNTNNRPPFRKPTTEQPTTNQPQPNEPNRNESKQGESELNETRRGEFGRGEFGRGEAVERDGRGEIGGRGGRGTGRAGRGGFGGFGGGFGGGNEEVVEYEVCGVVTIPGWLWMTKLSGVRKRGGRTGAMLLSPYEVVKNDFRIKDAGFFWFDRTLDSSGKPTVSDKELENTLQMLADKFAETAALDNKLNGVERGTDSSPSPSPVAPNFTDNNTQIRRPMVKVNSREYLTERVNRRADSVIQAAAKMPLIILAISSIGLMGTIAASVRMRRFELGVLRSLGVTRGGLVRLIVAEAVLISAAAIVISVGFGVVAAWCFIGLMRYTSFFGGFVSPLTIPVYWLSIGFAVTLILCFIAAIGPAIAAGRTETSKLLRE
ncbi:MAG: FtsX-like permease family protein [Planctomycetaceae bacterium]|jgi:putative ABC transport system permease protein|nr:FtsX-like permease family protein [Planctomycetaceae bacterium]